MTKEIYISDDMIQKIQKFDSIIFDCDGVLVDIRNSYDNAINKTISAIMNELFDDNISNIVNSKILYGLKAVGGFNDEVAVVYAVIMTLVASKKSNIEFKKLIVNVIDNIFVMMNCENSFVVKSAHIFEIWHVLYLMHVTV